mmetsp:Transcript_44105/g.64821  ORF Transcript_44105/g.64821 Transcript_44105/m.64821 type:complete len:211 (+) Transcript_44105:995-1627(+)
MGHGTDRRRGHGRHGLASMGGLGHYARRFGRIADYASGQGRAPIHHHQVQRQRGRTTRPRGTGPRATPSTNYLEHMAAWPPLGLLALLRHPLPHVSHASHPTSYRRPLLPPGRRSGRTRPGRNGPQPRLGNRQGLPNLLRSTRTRERRGQPCRRSHRRGGCHGRWGYDAGSTMRTFATRLAQGPVQSTAHRYRRFLLLGRGGVALVLVGL